MFFYHSSLVSEIELMTFYPYPCIQASFNVIASIRTLLSGLLQCMYLRTMLFTIPFL